MGRPPVVAIAVALLGLAAGVGAQQLDPISNMCNRFDHQSVVKNNMLYIDGGTETFVDNEISTTTNTTSKGNHITKGYNNFLIGVGTGSSWNWKTNISETSIAKTANPQTGITPPTLVNGALFHGTEDDNNIYLFGGTTSYFNRSFPGFQHPSSKAYGLWSYNIISKEWNRYDTSQGMSNRPSSGSSTEARDQGLNFYLNGEIDSGSSPETEGLGDGNAVGLAGMIVINTNNQTVRNVSTYGLSGDRPRTRGLLQYISGISSNGILVQIGGNQKTLGPTNTTDPVGDLIPMDQIDVFDVASVYHDSTPNGTWYKQQATGDVPAGRIDACLVLASSTDGSSHNIYVYGGRGLGNVTFDDVYVLSLPSFTWTKIFQGTSPRHSHTCHRLGSRLMLTVGGVASLDTAAETCDWETKGVAIFDMSSATWGSFYNQSAPSYTVPTSVVAKIGGTIKGAATLKQPVSGFDQPGLSRLLGIPVADPTPSLPPSPSSQSHTGAIVGGIVGGVVFLATLAAAIFWRRRFLRALVKGRPDPSQELDGNAKTVRELTAKEESWELSGEAKPIEMESPLHDDMKKPILKSPLSELGADVPRTWNRKPSSLSIDAESTPDERGGYESQKKESGAEDDTPKP